jgi:predicted metal-dependent phosphoesterase TrpH
MKIKVNLHFHTKDDIEDKGKAAMVADYDLFQGLDEAKKLGFDAIAVTCHDFVTDDRKYYEYAERLGINLIQGVEKTVEEKHVIILNADKSAETIETFNDLWAYRKEHPESFLLAPHPFFNGGVSLGSKLKEHADLFDAIEYSWFHFKFLNLNGEACLFAEKWDLPLLATSDTHYLKQLNAGYLIADAYDNSFASIKNAIHAGKFQNISPDVKFWSAETWRIIHKTLESFLKGRGEKSSS